MRGCFWYVGIPNYLEKMMAFLTAFLLIIFFFLKIVPIKSNKHTYGRYIKVIILFSFLSILNALLYWGQGPILSYCAGYGIYIYIYYFILESVQPNDKQIEKLLLVFSSLYAVLWFYAFSLAPETVFGYKDEIDDSRGMYRIALEGIDVVGLFYFYSLTNYLSNLKRIKYLIYAIFSYALVFASLSRMLIFGVTVVTLFYIIRKKSLKIILLFSVITALSWGAIMRNEIVTGLIELQKIQSDNPEGDRVLRSEYTDCISLYPFHIGTFLFGNGKDHINSEYGKREDVLKNTYHFNRSDAGYPGHYVTYGIISLIVFFLIFYRILKNKVPDNIYYCKLFIFYFILICFTTNHFISSGLSLTIVLYTLDVHATNGSLCFTRNHSYVRMSAPGESCKTGFSGHHTRDGDLLNSY